MLASIGQHIGRIVKIHGIRGQVFLVSENKLTKILFKTGWVFLMIDGLPVPFHLFIGYLAAKR